MFLYSKRGEKGMSGGLGRDTQRLGTRPETIGYQRPLSTYTQLQH
jgi:hypothetical protein